MATQPDNWEAVKELFEAALEEDPARRSLFLKERCPDAGLRAEVERLLAEYDQAGAFLSTPALGNLAFEAEDPTLIQRLSGGELLAGRFRIVRFIAGGGMGEVYEAEDQELRERVAIKTIRPEILTQPNAVARFKREVHLARKVTHPNVCRIFDIFRHRPEGGSAQEEIVFISMELLQGETLGAQLKADGRMNVGQALPLVQQMASALTAAHAMGIVHRDFKPGNVLLVGAPGKWRAVVTDFGLALSSVASDETGSLSIGQGLLGTPAYMSPEQIEGRPATAASDIYALGLVIYEMVTCARPFHGETPISAALKRLSETPTPPRTFEPGLSLAWQSVILRCLERDPAKRFSNAEEVARAISSEHPGVTPWPASRTGVTWIMAAAMAAVLLSAAIGYGVHRWRARVHPTAAGVVARRSVAVLGFRNLSGKPDAGWLSTALSELLTTELAAGEQLRTVPGENVARMKADLSLPDTDSLSQATLAKIHKNIGSDFVVLGSYLEMGNQIRVDLRVQDAKAGETIATVSDTGTETNLLDLVSKTGSELRHYLGVAEVTAAEVGAVRASAPPNPEAARLYAEGLQRLRVFDALGARDLLEKAVAAAPNYPMAHSALATAWATLGYDARATAEAKKAFDLSTNLPREDRLWIEANYRLRNKEVQKAIDIYRLLFEFFPDNVEYGLALAKVASSHGKARDGLTTLEALRMLPPPASDDPRIDLAEAEAAGALSDFHRQQQAAAKARTKAEAQGNILFVAHAQMEEGRAFEDLGEHGKAIALFREAKETYTRAGYRGEVAQALLNLAIELEEGGDYAHARTAGEESLAIWRQIGNQRGLAQGLMEMAIILRHEGDLPRARRLLEEARRIDHEIGNRQAESEVTGNMGNVLDDQGDIASARRAYEESLAVSQEIGDKLDQAISVENVGNELTALGQTGEARQKYEESRNRSVELGSKSLTTEVDLTYGDFLLKTGDIRAARQKFDEALRQAVELGEQGFIGAAHAAWGDLLAAGGDLPGAEKEYERAIGIFTKAGSKASLADARLSLAQLHVDQGDGAGAFDLATQSLQEFETEKSTRKQALAHLVLARALLAQGKVIAAQNEIQSAKELLRENQDRRLDLEFQITGAMVAGKNPGNAVAAAETLARSVLEAEKLGFVVYQFDARLALGEIEMELGTPGASARLKQLQRDASAKGFLLVARKAAALDAKTQSGQVRQKSVGVDSQEPQISNARPGPPARPPSSAC
jgi:tetratricopeptide (TPR) repeat protein/TolB-like protein/tRNA A-37 threonylcarbamoyl transferase component Bud32